jgi:hypothetical protein
MLQTRSRITLLPIIAFYLSACIAASATQPASPTPGNTPSAIFIESTLPPPLATPPTQSAPVPAPTNSLSGKVIFASPPFHFGVPTTHFYALEPNSEAITDLLPGEEGVRVFAPPAHATWKIGIVGREAPSYFPPDIVFYLEAPQDWPLCGTCKISPDERWLAYGNSGNSGNDGFGLWMINLSTGEKTIVVDNTNRQTSLYYGGGRWLVSGYGFLYTGQLKGFSQNHIYEPVTKASREIVGGAWTDDDLRVAGNGGFQGTFSHAGSDDVIGFNLERNLAFEARTDASETDMQWTPDQRHVIYTSRAVLPPDPNAELVATPHPGLPQDYNWTPGPAETWWLDSETGFAEPLLASPQYDFATIGWIEGKLIIRRTPYRVQAFHLYNRPEPIIDGGEVFLFDLVTQALTPYTLLTTTPRATRPPPVLQDIYQSPTGEYRLELRLTPPGAPDYDPELDYGSLWKVWPDGSEKELVKSGAFYFYVP